VYQSDQECLFIALGALLLMPVNVMFCCRWLIIRC